MTPADAQHDRLNGHIRSIGNLDLTRLAQLAHDAIDLEDRWPSRADGHRRTVPGASPATGPSGPNDIHLNTVEAAAASRLAGDDHDTAVILDALANIEKAAHLLHAALRNLDQIRTRRGGRLLPAPAPPTCWAMAQADPRGRYPVRCTIDIDDQTYPLSRWAYDWYRRHGRLPTADECRQRLDGRNVRPTKRTA